MFHIHRPLFFVSLSFMLGIVLRHYCAFAIGWVVAFIVVVFGLILFFYRRSITGVLMQVLFVALGFCHAYCAQIIPAQHVAHLTYWERQDTSAIEGVIVSDVDHRQTRRGMKTSFQLEVGRIKINGQWYSKSGKVLVNLFRKDDLRYGQRILLAGKIHKPFSDFSSSHFSYEDYLKRNGIRWIFSVKKDALIERLDSPSQISLRSMSLQCRRKLINVLEQYLSEIEAGVVQSLVLGGRYYVPDRVRDLFVQTGTAHILAISGMNVGAMAFIIFFLLNVLRVPRLVRIVATSLALVVYCFVTGAGPSVVRATIMSLIVLAGLLFEREQESLNSLGVAGLIILVMEPSAVFDIGFQLSFMGVFSIIFFYPLIYRLCDRWANGHWKTFLIQALCVSLAAWVGVAPMVAYYFQIITPVTIIANLPIIPFVSALFMLGVGLIAVGIFFPPAAMLFAACIKLVFLGLVLIVYALSRLPGAYFYVHDFSLMKVMIYYGVILLLVIVLSRYKNVNPVGDHAHFLS